MQHDGDLKVGGESLLVVVGFVDQENFLHWVAFWFLLQRAETSRSMHSDGDLKAGG